MRKQLLNNQLKKDVAEKFMFKNDDKEGDKELRKMSVLQGGSRINVFEGS